MPTVATSVILQYSHTIGRGEQFGPGFTTPVFVARGEADSLYVLCRASEYRPEGTRIIEENHVYYRIEPSGTRVRLEPGDSTILVENGVRYRVDPGGTRVRINNEGAAISVGPGGVEANVPVDRDTSVTVNTQ